MLNRYVIPEGLLKGKVFNLKMKGITPILKYVDEHPEGALLFEKKFSNLLINYPNSYHVIKLSATNFRYEIIARLMRLAAHTNNHMIVDAEEIRVQDSVDHMVNHMMSYNHNVFKTYQMIHSTAIKRLETDIRCYHNSDKVLNVKLMRCTDLHTDPTTSALYDTKEQIDHAYDCAIDLLLSHKQYVGKIVFATHDKTSFDKIVHASDDNIFHASLMGYDEPLTWNGYVKRMVYVPFGPYHKIYPYLLRRALQRTPSSWDDTLYTKCTSSSLLYRKGSMFNA